MFLTYNIHMVSAVVLSDYDGMNYYAAQELKFNYPMQPNDIFINQDLNYTAKVQTAIHEIVEAEIMRIKGWTYWPAHIIAFQSEIIPENLENMLAAFKSSKYYRHLLKQS